MISLIASSSIFQTILNFVLAFCILMVMVLVHETGHYVAGKIFHFKINEFAIGMGPKLLSKTKKNGEVISLRAFPLGGFCAFDGEATDTDNPNSFYNQKPWKRIIVLFAGVFFNFVSAVVITALFFAVVGAPSVSVYSTYEPVDSTKQCLFQEGDIVYKVNGNVVYFTTDIKSNLKSDSGNDVVIVRDGNFVELDDISTDSFKYVDEDGEEKTFVGLGISMSSCYYKYDFLTASGRVFGYVFAIAKMILQTLGGIFTGSVGLSELGGPVTTITLTAQVVSYGVESVLILFIFMSINLAVFNILPIPALDGCQMLFTLIEWIIHKPLNPKVVNWINTIGLFVLVGFVVFIDVIKLFI